MTNTTSTPSARAAQACVVSPSTAAPPGLKGCRQVPTRLGAPRSLCSGGCALMPADCPIARRLAVALGGHRAGVSCPFHVHCPKHQDEQQHEVEEQNDQSTCGEKLPAHGRGKQVDGTDNRCVGRDNAGEDYRGYRPRAMLRSRLGWQSFGSCSLRRDVCRGCVLTHSPQSFPSPCPRRGTSTHLAREYGLFKFLAGLSYKLTNHVPDRPGLRRSCDTALEPPPPPWDFPPRKRDDAPLAASEDPHPAERVERMAEAKLGVDRRPTSARTPRARAPRSRMRDGWLDS